jgi:hypothetical protein
MYLLYIFPLSSTHTYDFIVLTSLTHPRKILVVVLQIRKEEIGRAEDLSAALQMYPKRSYPFKKVLYSGVLHDV